jgi:pre-rRNA-processing protein TSR4|tara:strand:+ start:176 stop:625 length:450 start_codon:yes stop_codon:yes gene_type:complete
LGADVSARELRELEKMQDKDMVQLSRFHLRLRRSDQTQVVRYCFEDGAEPLWPSVTKAPNHRDVKNVPNCARCGAKRRFEFQILPQLINHLDVDCELASAVDFGSIAVYTCSRSCAPPETKKEGGEQTVSEISEAYAEEVALVHPPLNA